MTYRGKTNNLDHAIDQYLNLGVKFLVPLLFDGVEVIFRVLVDEGLVRCRSSEEFGCG